MRRWWRPPPNGVVNHTSRMAIASCSVTIRSPIDKQFESLWARASVADSTFQQRVQRTPGTIGDDRFAVAGAAQDDGAVRFAATDGDRSGADKKRVVD